MKETPAKFGRLPRDRDLILAEIILRMARMMAPVLPCLAPAHRRERARTEAGKLQQLFQEHDALQREWEHCTVDQAVTRGMEFARQLVNTYGEEADRQRVHEHHTQMLKIEADGEAVRELAAQHQGNPEELMQALRHHLTDNPENSFAHRRLVQELAGQGNLKEALRLQRERVRVTREMPVHAPSARLLLAKLLDQNQEREAAADEVRRLLREFPNGVVEHLEGGQLLLKAGDRTGAEQAWKRAERLCRGTTLAREVRRVVKESRLHH